MASWPKPNLQCLQCNGRMQTKDSRPAPFGSTPSVRRRRACVKCGWRVTTYEIMDHELIRQQGRMSAVLHSAQLTHELLGALIAAGNQFPDGLTTVSAGDHEAPGSPVPAGECPERAG